MNSQLEQLVGSEEFKTLPISARYEKIREEMSRIHPPFAQLPRYNQDALVGRIYRQSQPRGFGAQALDVAGAAASKVGEYLPIDKRTLGLTVAPFAAAQVVSKWVPEAGMAAAMVEPTYRTFTEDRMNPTAENAMRWLISGTLPFGLGAVRSEVLEQSGLGPEALAAINLAMAQAKQHGISEEDFRAQVEEYAIALVNSDIPSRGLANALVAMPEFQLATGVGGLLQKGVQKLSAAGFGKMLGKIAGEKSAEIVEKAAYGTAKKALAARFAGVAANSIGAATVFEAGGMLAGEEFKPLDVLYTAGQLAALHVMLLPTGAIARRIQQGPMPAEVATELAKPEFKDLKVKPVSKLIRAYADDHKFPLDKATDDVLEMIGSPAPRGEKSQVPVLARVGQTLAAHPELIATDPGVHFARKIRANVPQEWVEGTVTIAPSGPKTNEEALAAEKAMPPTAGMSRAGARPIASPGIQPQGIRITYETKVSRKPMTVIAADVAEARKILGDQANNILEVKARPELLGQLKLGKFLALPAPAPQPVAPPPGPVIAGFPPSTRSGRGLPWERQFVGVPPERALVLPTRESGVRIRPEPLVEPSSLEAIAAQEAVQAAQVESFSPHMEVMLNSPEMLDRVVEAAKVGNPAADPYQALREAAAARAPMREAFRSERGAAYARARAGAVPARPSLQAPMIERPGLTPAISGAARPEAQALLFERPSSAPSLAGVAGEVPRAPEISLTRRSLVRKQIDDPTIQRIMDINSEFGERFAPTLGEIRDRVEAKTKRRNPSHAVQVDLKTIDEFLAKGSPSPPEVTPAQITAQKKLVEGVAEQLRDHRNFLRTHRAKDGGKTERALERQYEAEKEKLEQLQYPAGRPATASPTSYQEPEWVGREREAGKLRVEIEKSKQFLETLPAELSRTEKYRPLGAQDKRLHATRLSSVRGAMERIPLEIQKLEARLAELERLGFAPAPEVTPAQLAAGLAELGVEGVEPALAPKVPQARGSAEKPAPQKLAAPGVAVTWKQYDAAQARWNAKQKIVDEVRIKARRAREDPAYGKETAKAYEREVDDAISKRDRIRVLAEPSEPRSAVPQKLAATEDAVRAAGLQEPGAIKVVADMVAADVIKPGQAGPLAAVVAEQRPPRGPVTTLADPKPAIRPDPSLQAMTDKQLLAHGETRIFTRATTQTRWSPETAEKVAAYMDEVVRRTGIELPLPTAEQTRKGLYQLFLELRAESRTRLTELGETWKTKPERGMIYFWGPRSKQPARDFVPFPDAEPVRQLAELMGYKARATRLGSYVIEIPDGQNVFQLRFGSRESALLGLRRMAQQAGDYARYQKQLGEISAGFEGKVSPETAQQLAAEWKQAPEFDEKGNPSVKYYEVIFGDRIAPINSWERLQIGHKGATSLVVTAGRTIQGFGPGGERAVERMVENQTLQERAKPEYMPRFQAIMKTLTPEEIRTGLHALARKGVQGRPELQKALDDLRGLTLELYHKLEALGGPVAKLIDNYWPNVFDPLTVTGWRAAEKDVLPLIDELRSRGIIKADADSKDVLKALLARGIGTSRERTIAKLMKQAKKKGFALDRGNAGRLADELRDKLRDRYSGHLEREQNHAFADEITDARHAWGTTILEEIRRVSEVQVFGLRDAKINRDLEAIRQGFGTEAETFAKDTFAWEIGQERADLNPFMERLYQLGAAKLSLAWINELSSSRIKAWQAFGTKAYLKAMQETKFNPFARSRIGLELGVNSPEIYGKIRRDSFGTTVDPVWWQNFWKEVLPEKLKAGTPMEKLEVGLEAWTRGMAGLHRIATESGRSLTGQMARFGFDEHLEMLRRGDPREMGQARKFFERFGMPPDKMIALARSEDAAGTAWARDYFAVQATNNIQFRPGILTRPAWARGNGKYFYQFQTWSFNQAQQIFEDLNYSQHKDWTRFRRTAAGLVLFMGAAPGAAMIRGILTKNTDPADKMIELARRGGFGYLAAASYALAYSGALGLYSDAMLAYLDGDLWKNQRIGAAPVIQTARTLFLDLPGLGIDWVQGESGAARTATRLTARELAGGLGAAAVEHTWPKPSTGGSTKLGTGGFGQGFGKGFTKGF